jgi:hypothetical protein
MNYLITSAPSEERESILKHLKTVVCGQNIGIVPPLYKLFHSEGLNLLKDKLGNLTLEEVINDHYFDASSLILLDFLYQLDYSHVQKYFAELINFMSSRFPHNDEAYIEVEFLNQTQVNVLNLCAEYPILKRALFECLENINYTYKIRVEFLKNVLLGETLAKRYMDFLGSCLQYLSPEARIEMLLQALNYAENLSFPIIRYALGKHINEEPSMTFLDGKSTADLMVEMLEKPEGVLFLPMPEGKSWEQQKKWKDFYCSMPIRKILLDKLEETQKKKKGIPGNIRNCIEILIKLMKTEEYI